MRQLLFPIGGWHLGVALGKLMLVAMGGPFHAIAFFSAAITAAVVISAAVREAQ